MDNMNVYQRLNKARNEFHALELKKSGHNKFAGYFYFELGDFLIPALKVFSSNGLCAVVSFSADIAHMAIRNVDKIDDFIMITSPMGSAALKGCHEVQNIGAVETYQRRYLWVAALEIVEHDALDSSEPIKEKKPESAKSVPQSELDKLSDDRKKVVADLSVEIIDTFRDTGADEAFDLYEQAKNNLTDEREQIALWGMFASDIKSGIKKIGTQRKEQQ